MATPYWAFSSEGDPNLVATMIMKEHIKKCEFAALTGQEYQKTQGLEISPAFDMDNPKPTGAMITEFQDLKSGGSQLTIPIFIQNDTMPKIGDADMTNEGVTDDFAWIRVEVNQINFAHELVKGMQAQILMKNGLSQRLNNAKDSLGFRMTLFTDKDLYHTVFNGVSISLCTLGGNEGTRNQLTPHSHANFYVGGSLNDFVSGNDCSGGYTNRPGTEAYENDLITALNTLTVDDKFNTKLIEELEFQASRLNIPRFSTKVGERYIMIVSPAALRQLNQDPDYIYSKQIGSQGAQWDGQMFNNYRAQWSQTLIFVGSRIPGIQGTLQGVTSYGAGVNHNMPKYGNTDFYTKLKSEHPATFKLGILCGPDMLVKAYGAEGIRIDGAINVDANREKVILRATLAYVLADYYDKDGHFGVASADQVWKNQSSLVFCTISPDRG